jgi:hypothetical protein
MSTHIWSSRISNALVCRHSETFCNGNKSISGGLKPLDGVGENLVPEQLTRSDRIENTLFSLLTPWFLYKLNLED